MYETYPKICLSLCVVVAVVMGVWFRILNKLPSQMPPVANTSVPGDVVQPSAQETAAQQHLDTTVSHVTFTSAAQASGFKRLHHQHRSLPDRR